MQPIRGLKNFNGGTTGVSQHFVLWTIQLCTLLQKHSTTNTRQLIDTRQKVFSSSVPSRPELERGMSSPLPPCSQFDQLLEFPHECRNYSTTFPVFEGSQIAQKSPTISGISDVVPRYVAAAAAQRGEVIREQARQINRYQE